MLFCHIFLVVSLMSFLQDFHVSSCDKNCPDKPVFTPSKLVVKFGDPASASCSVCQHACSVNNIYDLESPVGNSSKNGTTISWTIDRLTEWITSPLCFYNNNTDYQCCTVLPVTLYQPPDNVSVSFGDHTGPMLEGQRYTLRCAVQEVAPVENLTVTFYRGRTALGQLRSDNKSVKPVSETFSLNITPSKEDDGVQYWCEAKLELGPDGPQRPPVVTSQTITATVLYMPQPEGWSHPETITVKVGQPLRLDCSAVGNPGPSYSWTVPPGSSSTSNGSVLTIDSATFADEGNYTCSASNAIGAVAVKLDVKVKANHMVLIIAVIVAAAVVIAILSLLAYVYCYKQNRMGQYNPKDVFSLHQRHSAVPTVE
ncbi:cell adhesion molecule 4-like [Clinocottus analis]|uniref:cell adhesion molecule 4-like n=1 Tax=Clinocottus analis TaxID=304258 RepID=UPI0035C105F5